MLKVIVQREKEYENIKYPAAQNKVSSSTIGTLKVVNEDNKEIFNCFTLENIGPSTDESGKDKRIVARKYNLEWTSTSIPLPSKYTGRGLLLTCDKELPSFRNRRILIHIGNYDADTLGCLLLGNKDGKNGVIFESTDAVLKFYDLVSKYGAENFELEIKEI